MTTSKDPTGASSGTTAQSGRPAKAGKRARLAPSRKYEIDRTTIRSICATAKQGALDALTAAVLGRRGKTAEQVELEAARAEIERLKATVCEQAVALHLEQGRTHGTDRRRGRDPRRPAG